MKVGVAFTRFQTKYFQGKYGNLDSTLISYGPCQIPTLNFCVERYPTLLRIDDFLFLTDRHQAINEFTPEPYWTLELKINKTGVDVFFSWERGRIFDQSVASMFEATVHNHIKIKNPQ